jgi:hypothetical protein
MVVEDLRRNNWLGRSVGGGCIVGFGWTRFVVTFYLRSRRRRKKLDRWFFF